MTRYKLDNQSSFDIQEDQINIYGPNKQSLSLTLEDFQRIAMALIEADRLSEFKLKAPYLEPVPEPDGPQKVYNPDGSLRAFIWYEDGVFHRNGGPAVDCANGCREWWIKGEWQQTEWRKVEGGKLQGQRHREDGPAIERPGRKEWWLNGEWRRTEYYNEDGEWHCEDGPAVENVDGSKYWYWYGKEVTREQHQKLREAHIPHFPNIIMGPVTPMPIPQKKINCWMDQQLIYTI